jgi:hypothetical protein
MFYAVFVLDRVFHGLFSKGITLSVALPFFSGDRSI